MNIAKKPTAGFPRECGVCALTGLALEPEKEYTPTPAAESPTAKDFTIQGYVFYPCSNSGSIMEPIMQNFGTSLISTSSPSASSASAKSNKERTMHIFSLHSLYNRLRVFGVDQCPCCEVSQMSTIYYHSQGRVTVHIQEQTGEISSIKPLVKKQPSFNKYPQLNIPCNDGTRIETTASNKVSTTAKNATDFPAVLLPWQKSGQNALLPGDLAKIKNLWKFLQYTGQKISPLSAAASSSSSSSSRNSQQKPPDGDFVHGGLPSLEGYFSAKSLVLEFFPEEKFTRSASGARILLCSECQCTIAITTTTTTTISNATNTYQFSGVGEPVICLKQVDNHFYSRMSSSTSSYSNPHYCYYYYHVRCFIQKTNNDFPVQNLLKASLEPFGLQDEELQYLKPKIDLSACDFGIFHHINVLHARKTTSTVDAANRLTKSLNQVRNMRMVSSSPLSSNAMFAPLQAGIAFPMFFKSNLVSALWVTKDWDPFRAEAQSQALRKKIDKRSKPITDNSDSSTNQLSLSSTPVPTQSQPDHLNVANSTLYENNNNNNPTERREHSFSQHPPVPQPTTALLQTTATTPYAGSTSLKMRKRFFVMSHEDNTNNFQRFSEKTHNKYNNNIDDYENTVDDDDDNKFNNHGHPNGFSRKSHIKNMMASFLNPFAVILDGVRSSAKSNLWLKKKCEELDMTENLDITNATRASNGSGGDRGERHFQALHPSSQVDVDCAENILEWSSVILSDFYGSRKLLTAGFSIVKLIADYGLEKLPRFFPTTEDLLTALRFSTQHELWLAYLPALYLATSYHFTLYHLFLACNLSVDLLVQTGYLSALNALDLSATPQTLFDILGDYRYLSHVTPNIEILVNYFGFTYHDFIRFGATSHVIDTTFQSTNHNEKYKLLKISRETYDGLTKFLHEILPDQEPHLLPMHK